MSKSITITNSAIVNAAEALDLIQAAADHKLKDSNQLRLLKVFVKEKVQVFNAAREKTNLSAYDFDRQVGAYLSKVREERARLAKYRAEKREADRKAREEMLALQAVAA